MNNTIRLLPALAAALLVPALASATEVEHSMESSPSSAQEWYLQGEEAVEENERRAYDALYGAHRKAK